MGRLQVIIITAVIGVVVIVSTGFTAYNAAYPGAFAAGRAEGYKAGDAAGYNRGESDGYQKGLAAPQATNSTALIAQATKDGYNDGQRAGNATGYQAGLTAGDFAGYNRGYLAGYDAGRVALTKNGIVLGDFSAAEVEAFLKNDTTSTHQFAAGIYDDKYFARDVCNNAEGHGIRCAYVLLYFTDTTTHALVGFKIGSGVSYYEPQTDASVTVKINDIWVDNITKDNKRVKDILVVW